MEKVYRQNCPLCTGKDFEFVFCDWQNNRFVRCLNCHLIFQDPYIKTKYEDDYWQQALDPDGRKRNLFSERDFKLKNWYGQILSFINNQPPVKVLDIGCGPAFLLSAIDNKHKKYGVEISGLCVQYVKENFPDINIQQSLLDETAFGEGFFDIVLLYHVIEHLDEPLRFLSIINKILAKDGTIIVGTPNIESFCAKRFKGNFRLLGQSHITIFSEKTLEMILDKAGFKVYQKEFPFFKTEYFNFRNILRLWDVAKISPPFYKSIMTFYARKDF